MTISEPRLHFPRLVGRAGGLAADQRLESLRFVVSLLTPEQLATLDDKALARVPLDSLAGHLRRTTPASRVVMYAAAAERNGEGDVFGGLF